MILISLLYDGEVGASCQSWTRCRVRAPPVLPVVEGDEQDIIDELDSHADGDLYLRRTVKLDMRAIAKDHPVADGLVYVQCREQLVITPVTSGEKIAMQL